MTCTCVDPNCAAVTTPWTPIGFVDLSATDVSSTATLAGTGVGLIVLVTNQGPAVAYVALGTSSVVATTSSTPLQPGDSLALPQGTSTTAAAITGSGLAATLVVTSGSGCPLVVSGQLVVNDAAVVAILTGTGTFATGTFVAIEGESNVLFPAASPSAPRLRVKAINLDYPTPSGGAGSTFWLSWGAAASVRGPGSFYLLPGTSFDDARYPNQGSLNVIAEDGTAPQVYWETY